MSKPRGCIPEDAPEEANVADKIESTSEQNADENVEGIQPDSRKA